MQNLVGALDADQSGDISRAEFDQGFTKIVAGLVRRGTINRMEDVKKIAESTIRVAQPKHQSSGNIQIPSSKD